MKFWKRLASQGVDTFSRKIISILCYYSVIVDYNCLPQMEPLEDSNERSIVFEEPRGTQERLDYGRLLRSPRGREDHTKLSHKTD